MSSSHGESTASQSQSSASDSACFECNICFDLAQDPIVTLCGHLFCWPCLYKWLHVHSHSPECPVCKATIEEEKLVPLYGRGKAPSDPRSRSVPGENIPHRPTGQRPETAPHANLNQTPQQQGIGVMGGFPPMATARWGNFTFSTGFGGLFPSLFNFHVHGFPDAAGHGPHPGFPHTFHSGHSHGFPHQHHHHHHHHHLNALGQQADSNLAMLFAIVGALVIVTLICL